MSESPQDQPQTRLWQHEGLWRIQSLHQLPDRHGIMCDAWESWRDENGRVLFFESEKQARAYLDGEAKKVEEGKQHEAQPDRP